MLLRTFLSFNTTLRDFCEIERGHYDREECVCFNPKENSGLLAWPRDQTVNYTLNSNDPMLIIIKTES